MSVLDRCRIYALPEFEFLPAHNNQIKSEIALRATPLNKGAMCAALFYPS